MRHAAASLLLLTALAGLALPKGLDPVVLKRVSKPGDKAVMTLKGTLSAQGQSFQLTARVGTVVKSVDTDGTAHCEDTPIEGTINGQPVQKLGATIRYAVKPTGAWASYESDGKTPPSTQMLMGFYYPSAPVQVGSTWTVTTTGAAASGIPDLTTSFKLTGEESVDGVKAFKVEGSLKEAKADAAVAQNVYWIDEADGSILKEQSKLSNVDGGGGVKLVIDSLITWKKG